MSTHSKGRIILIVFHPAFSVLFTSREQEREVRVGERKSRERGEKKLRKDRQGGREERWMLAGDVEGGEEGCCQNSFC